MILNTDHWATGVPLMSRGVSVLCLDPGETTGWVWALIGHHELTGSGGSDPSGLTGVSRAVWSALKADPIRVRHGEVNLWKEGEGSLYSQEAAMARGLGIMARQASSATARILNATSIGNDAARLTHVVCEDFIVRNGSQDRNLLTPVRLATGLFNEIDKDDELSLHWHFQSASDAKGTVDNDTLKSMGLYFKGDVPHARDAARHLVRFLRGYKRSLV